MGARRFNGTSDHITLSLGALNFAFGPGTIAAAASIASDTGDKDIFSAGTGVDYAMFVDGTTHNLRLFIGGSGGSASTFTALASEGWLFLAATKATGTVTPTLHKYVYATSTWTHQAGATARPNSAAADTSAEIGEDVGGGSFFNGDVAVIGVWNTELTNAQIERLPLDTNYTTWNSYPLLKGYWTLGQDVVAQTVTDATGGGANQSAISGTTTTANAPFLAPPPPKTDRRELVYMRQNR